MREIKFRAWLPTEKRMTWSHSLKEILSICSLGYPDFAEWMQFTGLKDNNGVEIYEGDIVHYALGIGVVEYLTESPTRASFSIVRRDVKGIIIGVFSFNTGTHHNEVIGNIHEHPHLLTP